MKWYDAELIGQKAETPTTRRYWFKLKSDTPVEYDAGQFFVFDLPTGDKRKDRWRSYSIGNAFDGSNLIELCISYLKNGLASEYFFETINKGDILKCKGPEGGFVLNDRITHPLVMICTGTGIAPFRAMIQKMEKQSLHYPEVHLIFGTRKAKDILYFEDIQDWCNYIPGFKATICLSREKTLPSNHKNLEFRSGYIHQAYLKEHSLDKLKSHFMICGWTKIIDEVVSNLILQLKVDRSQIKYELFG